jgi:hypothetical protein
MTTLRYRLWLAIGLILLLGLHVIWQRALFSLIPLALTIPLVLTWIARRPLPYLLGWAVIVELLSTTPLGLMTALTLVPWFVRLTWRRAEADLSFSFLVVVVGTVLLQLVGRMGYELALTAYRHGLTGGDLVYTAPWSLTILTLLLTTVVGYSLIVVEQQLRPHA